MVKSICVIFRIFNLQKTHNFTIIRDIISKINVLEVTMEDDIKSLDVDDLKIRKPEKLYSLFQL